MIRIAITGPESTGKTTLSKTLAQNFNCHWVPEFARIFLENTNGYYTFEDLDLIAKGQLEAWQRHTNDELCFYDTEMLVMKIWSSFKFGKVSDFIHQAYQYQAIDLFLLCKTDIDWEEDELREHPEKRDELFELYFNALSENKIPFKIIEGNYDERIQLAIKIVSDFLHKSIKK